MRISPRLAINLTITVAALGYFVDLYDILLFSVVRTTSLKELGLSENESLDMGLILANWQVAGLLIGGILWGVLGDKKGRLSILFGSILLYSLANIANAYVHSVEMYKIWRLIAGVGLAGELGAGITIVTEIMSPQRRGIGTMMVTVVGMFGAILAAIVGTKADWRTAYLIGGLMGLALLVMRISIRESGMYKRISNENVEKGNFFALFRNWKIFFKFVRCFLIGLPTFFVQGLLLLAVPELGREFGIETPINTGVVAVMIYPVIAVSEFVCSWVSQRLRSRRNALFIFLTITLAGVLIFFLFPPDTALGFYWRYAIMAFGVGFWVTMVTNAAEQFGTNLRATVTTSAPNIIRGFLAPMNKAMIMVTPIFGLIDTAMVIGVASIVLAMLSVYFSEETFGKDLDYTE
jgi:putative MFS transporter